MTMPSNEIIILAMAVITFSCRYLFFMKTLPIQLGKKSKRMLKFTAPSVLTAMWSPIVFLEHQTTGSDFTQSPYLYGGIIAIVLSLKLQSTLTIIMISMASFLAVDFISNIL